MLAGGRRQYRRGKAGAKGAVEATDKGMSPRAVEAMHKTIKASFALAIDKGLLVRNPAALATPPTVVEQRHSWWQPEEVGAFLRYVAELGDKAVLPVGLVDALVDTGGRRGEVLGLRWCDVDLEAGTATIRRQLTAHPETKTLEIRPTKRPRSKSVISLHPSTVTALKRRRTQQSVDRLKMGGGWPTDDIAADLVFTWADGQPIPPDSLTKIVGRLSVAAGLPRLTPHGLRHSFASAALAARVPVEVVAGRLGNTARIVQEVYAHVIPAEDQSAALVVGELYRADRG